MKKVPFPLLPPLALTVFGVLAGCAAPGNKPLVQPGTEVGVIEVRNAVDRAIVDLRIGRCGDTLGFGSDYGYDRLEGRRIEPGQALRFDASYGCYNVSALSGSNSFFGTSREHFGTVVVNESNVGIGVWTVR